jgi:hypothetical protein
MRLYRAASALLLEHERQTYALPGTSLDPLLARDDLHEYLLRTIAGLPAVAALPPDAPLLHPLAPRKSGLLA